MENALADSYEEHESSLRLAEEWSARLREHDPQNELLRFSPQGFESGDDAAREALATEMQRRFWKLTEPMASKAPLEVWARLLGNYYLACQRALYAITGQVDPTPNFHF